MVIKFGSLAPDNVFITIGGLKFGSMVWYRHLYMHMEKSLAILIVRFKCIPSLTESGMYEVSEAKDLFYSLIIQVKPPPRVRSTRLYGY